MLAGAAQGRKNSICYGCMGIGCGKTFPNILVLTFALAIAKIASVANEKKPTRNVAIPLPLHEKLSRMANVKGMKLKALTAQLLELAIKLRLAA